MAHILGGHYEVIRPLSSGGFGQTYLAEDIHLQGLKDRPQRVIKQLQPQSKDPAIIKIAQRLFNTEAETLDKLGTHDQIPQLFAKFEENQEFYLVQEYIQGASLKQEIINGRPLPEPQVRELVHNILEVLDFVHQNNVIHRDLKPENIMRRAKDQKIVLIDFGIAKKISSQMMQQGHLPKLTVPIGTPGYTPPEQEKGQPTLASDIYAVGMIAIEAFTGIAPDQLQKDQKGEIIWRNQATVSPDFAAIIDIMVRSKVSDRYQNAQEVLNKLISTIVLPQYQSRPATQPLVTQPSSSPTLLKRYPLLVLLSGVAIAIVISFLTSFIFVGFHPPSSPPSPPSRTRGPL